jgi:hypothetical protein
MEFVGGISTFMELERSRRKGRVKAITVVERPKAPRHDRLLAVLSHAAPPLPHLPPASSSVSPS